MKLDLEVSGAQTAKLEDYAAQLHFEEIKGEPNPKVVWFFSVSAIPGKWVTLQDGRYLLFTADLSPGLYTGPGTYELSPSTAGTNVGGASGPPSGSYIAFLSPPPEPGEIRFGTIAQPCTLTIGDRYRTGSMSCPKLTASDGKSVAVRWDWELT